VLLLNHVLQQEPEAQARLKRQAGAPGGGALAHFSVELVATPAGLLDLASPAAAPTSRSPSPMIRPSRSPGAPARREARCAHRG
jgi:hypothetical protein